MKKLLIILLALAFVPALAGVWDKNEKQQIRTRFAGEAFGKPGSLGNPYVIVNEYGQELKVLRPRYAVPLGPEPEYQPGGTHNPLVLDPYGR
ncbi:MAG: hypothetical protein H8E10_20045 [Desulfobacterales bacterium]|nr:hypothetical protein [Desulfobacterales bacterium]